MARTHWARWTLATYGACALLAGLGWLGSSWQKGLNRVEHLPPGAGAWLGTHQLGRDIAAMVAQGAWTAFLIGGLAAGGATLVGALLGMGSGWRPGWLDRFALWLSSAVSAIPGMILILVIAAAMGPGLPALIVAIAAVSWVSVYRLVRAETRRLREEEFVQTALAQGESSIGILVRHLTPHFVPLVLVQFGLGFVGAIQAEAVLSFLGLGAPEYASWGRMIAEAWTWDDLGHGRWWRLMAASLALGGLAISVLTLSRSAARRPGRPL
ncbi:MAG: ABC transporter permease [Planctomycetes bacterium]|nr:ABC transporter permease [Planctomycetota bacterium]